MPDLKSLSGSNADGIARSATRDLGLNLTPEAETAFRDAVASSLAFRDGELVALDDAGIPAVQLAPDGSVVDCDPSEHLVALAKRFAGVPSSTGPAIGGSGPSANRTALAMARISAEKAGKLNPALADAAAAHGNPWLAAGFNRSRQAIIANHNPALAARLRQEATP